MTEINLLVSDIILLSTIFEMSWKVIDVRVLLFFYILNIRTNAIYKTNIRRSD